MQSAYTHVDTAAKHNYCRVCNDYSCGNPCASPVGCAVRWCSQTPVMIRQTTMVPSAITQKANFFPVGVFRTVAFRLRWPWHSLHGSQSTIHLPQAAGTAWTPIDMWQLSHTQLQHRLRRNMYTEIYQAVTPRAKHRRR